MKCYADKLRNVKIFQKRALQYRVSIVEERSDNLLQRVSLETKNLQGKPNENLLIINTNNFRVELELRLLREPPRF